MLAYYADWSQDVGVIEKTEGYTPVAQIGKNLGSVLLGRYWPWLLGALALLLFALGGTWTAMRATSPERARPDQLRTLWPRGCTLTGKAGALRLNRSIHFRFVFRAAFRS